MLSGQREACGGVIEGGIGPRNRAVASGAGCRNAGLLVIGIVGAVVVLDVAGGTILGGEVVVSVGMALRALQSGMCSGQRKSDQVVIERCRLPGTGAVATPTGLWEVRGHMVGVGGPAEIRQVASDAGRRRTFEFAADVARVAVERGMHSGQRKAGVFKMVEVHPKPAVEAMALLAIGGEARGHVRRASGSLILLRVAGVALRGHGGKLTQCSILVACVAVHCSVRAEQREPVGVALNLFDRNLPSVDGVTLFAIGPKLALVNVGMTVGAFLADVGEDRLNVALSASDVLMHAAERVAGLAVIKLGNVADGFPSTLCVAILTGDIQRAMRAPRAGVDLRLRSRGGTGAQEQQRQHQSGQNRRTQYGPSKHIFPERRQP